MLRNYNLYRPGLPEGAQAALMIVLHGGLGNAESIEHKSAMNAVAERGKFLVAYPQGTAPRVAGMSQRRTWNAGTCCGAAVRRNVDDVGFIAACIDDVAAHHALDRRRVYAVGLSNGAMLAYRLASEIPDELAAVVAVAGSLGVDDCSKAKDVPVLHIHGARDAHVPFSGGRGAQSLSTVEYRSVAETLGMLLAPRRSRGCDQDTSREGIERSAYRCADGAPVELVLLRDAGHGWPGGCGAGAEAGSVSDFCASEEAWSFARRFEKETWPNG